MRSLAVLSLLFLVSCATPHWDPDSFYSGTYSPGTVRLDGENFVSNANVAYARDAEIARQAAYSRLLKRAVEEGYTYFVVDKESSKHFPAYHFMVTGKFYRSEQEGAYPVVETIMRLKEFSQANAGENTAGMIQDAAVTDDDIAVPVSRPVIELTKKSAARKKAKKKPRKIASRKASPESGQMTMPKPEKIKTPGPVSTSGQKERSTTEPEDDLEKRLIQDVTPEDDDGPKVILAPEPEEGKDATAANPLDELINDLRKKRLVTSDSVINLLRRTQPPPSKTDGAKPQGSKPKSAKQKSSGQKAKAQPEKQIAVEIISEEEPSGISPGFAIIKKEDRISTNENGVVIFADESCDVEPCDSRQNRNAR